MDLNDVVEVIGQARKVRDAGDRATAKTLLLDALQQAMAEDNRFLACCLTHDLGHAEEEPIEQLRWHLEALEHADAVRDDRVRDFYPSLHVNIGATCLTLGDRDRARVHVEAAQSMSGMLRDDSYGAIIRAGIADAVARLDAVEAAERPPANSALEPTTP